MQIPSLNEYLRHADHYVNQLLNSREHKYDQLIVEGGASGHMNHPFDDLDLTFADLKQIIDQALQGKLDIEGQPTEKTDGQNIWVTVQNGEVKFARNKSEAIDPMDADGFSLKFDEHPYNVRQAFQTAIKDLADNLSQLPEDAQVEYFDEGKNFANIEIIYSKSPNVIHYDQDLLQFHDIKVTDGQGQVVETLDLAPELVEELEAVEANLAETYTFIPPRFIQLQADVDFDQNQPKLINQVNQLRDKYNLSDQDPIMKYHEGYWREIIDREFSDLPEDLKQGLIQRWAYGNKRALNFRGNSLQTNYGIDGAQMERIKEYDKNSTKQQFKQIIKPFETIILKLGSIVLKNITNLIAANPKAEAQRLKDSIQQTANQIRTSGSLEQINKIEEELQRLQEVGGLDSIIPSEGIVFQYKGKKYKLTGSFAAINQLMGIMKFGR